VQRPVSVAVFAALLTALTWFVFPGHTYLQQDTQIYVPMFEKLADPALFAHDLLTSRPHVSWTVFDEVSVGLHRATGLGFEAILVAQQLLFRALGIWGVYLIAKSLGLTRRLAMFVAALFSLGTMIVGPQVLTLEYEPVPRGFAIPLVLCAIGLALYRRWTAASVLATVAMLYQAPATAPFWVVFAVLLVRARVWKPVLIPAGGMVLLVLTSIWQPGEVLRQPLFSTISPALAEVQKMRASYNWVSLWPGTLMVHYTVMTLIAAGAMVRLRERLTREHLIVFGGLLAVGVLSVPVSYATLEGMRWTLIPQFQPARALLFVTSVAIILSAAAGIHSAFERRYAQCFTWLLVPFLIPIHQVITPPYRVKDALLITALAAAATGAVAVHVIVPRRAAAALAMVALGAYFAIPLIGGVRNYPALWNNEIVELSEWARTSTDPNAVFLFPRAGKDLHPGIFRAEARRAVYVDWKSGGQVNYFEDEAMEWWSRWRDTMLRRASDAELAARGVNYVVVELKDRREGVLPVYSNAIYAVYRLAPHD
jgi:hypothetical protein